MHLWSEQLYLAKFLENKAISLDDWLQNSVLLAKPEAMLRSVTHFGDLDPDQVLRTRFTIYFLTSTFFVYHLIRQQYFYILLLLNQTISFIFLLASSDFNNLLQYNKSL